jgi:hypothetical protein
MEKNNVKSVNPNPTLVVIDKEKKMKKPLPAPGLITRAQRLKAAVDFDAARSDAHSIGLVVSIRRTFDIKYNSNHPATQDNGVTLQAVLAYATEEVQKEKYLAKFRPLAKNYTANGIVVVGKKSVVKKCYDFETEVRWLIVRDEWVCCEPLAGKPRLDSLADIINRNTGVSSCWYRW